MSKQLFVTAKNPSEQKELAHWKEWVPNLYEGHLRMQAMIDSMPGAPPEAIPEEIKALENPESPWALPGAITLERHDCVHVLLGRGMLQQDEAFVLGFTMGTSKQVTNWQYTMFRSLAVNWYPSPYNFSPQDLFAFDLGFARGEDSRCININEFPFEDHMDKSIDEVRKMVGININRLYRTYMQERTALPDSIVSKRLPVMELSQ